MVDTMTRHQRPGHECPECNGTGVVLVFPHRGVAKPLSDLIGKDEFRETAMPYAEPCGVCGGDGWISRIDELTGDHQTPVDWLLNEKRQMGSAMRKHLVDR